MTATKANHELDCMERIATVLRNLKDRIAYDSTEKE